MMNILHTEASPGWGGQELRILREAEGMRARGHQVILALKEHGGLVKPAREAGFLVYELPFKKARAITVFYQLMRLIRKHGITHLNTHSSLDAWIGGIAGKISGCRVIRTRHLSTPIRKGWNSRLLYNWLADAVVTTCEKAAELVRTQAHLMPERCLSIPTGVDPAEIQVDPQEVQAFRQKLGIAPTDCLIGTLCVLRGWKGISDLLQAAKKLEANPALKWVIIGDGVSEAHFKEEWRALGLEGKVFFTGRLVPPYTALAALDIFVLLSWGHEGVSQASLQAAWLQKPLVTTPIGGLPEVCIPDQTGLLVPVKSPEAVAEAVFSLSQKPEVRKRMGEAAKNLVASKFTLKHTLDQMEAIYAQS